MFKSVFFSNQVGVFAILFSSDLSSVVPYYTLLAKVIIFLRNYSVLSHDVINKRFNETIGV